MGVLEDIADKLAKDTMDLVAKTGDEMLVGEMTKAIGATSTTLEEAYLTAIRIRSAESRARTLLQKKTRQAQTAAKAII